MVGKTAPIKRLDEVRFHVIQEYCGCLACLLQGHELGHEAIALTTIEHVTEHGRRLPDEHQATIGLCPYHHFGTPWRMLRRDDMLRILGPSLAHGRKPFEAHFGDEVKVLLPVQDELILLFAGDPWPAYTMPRAVRKTAVELWTRLRRSECP